MTSKAIDKENSSTTAFGSLTNAKSLGLGNAKTLAFQAIKSERTNSTPVVSLEKNTLISNSKECTNTAGKQRRALGDVLNTATQNRQKVGLGITPKVDRTLQCDNTPSGPSKVAKSFSKLKLSEFQQQQQQGVACGKSQEDDTELPPAERFIGSKYDNFDDLFSDGRLSGVFLEPESVKFNTNLNQRGSHFYGQDFEDKIKIDYDEDGLFEVELKKVRKSLKKMNKKVELKAQEIECLDDLMPKIAEDSFEDY